MALPREFKQGPSSLGTECHVQGKAAPTLYINRPVRCCRRYRQKFYKAYNEGKPKSEQILERPMRLC